LCIDLWQSARGTEIQVLERQDKRNICMLLALKSDRLSNYKLLTAFLAGSIRTYPTSSILVNLLPRALGQHRGTGFPITLIVQSANKELWLLLLL